MIPENSCLEVVTFSEFAFLWTPVFWNRHSDFLLSLVAWAPQPVHSIPLSTLGAVRVHTGTRLASPKEFAHVLELGKEQLAFFVTTILLTLAFDLLAGIAGGIGLKLLMHAFRGGHFTDLFRARTRLETAEDTVIVTVYSAAVLSHFLGLKRHVERIPDARRVVIDRSKVHLVDHAFMHPFPVEKVERRRAGGSLELRGLEGLRAASRHPIACRMHLFSDGGDAELAG